VSCSRPWIKVAWPYRFFRGIFSTLSIDFDLKEGDVAARVSFATVDGESRVVDRRAGRIDTETNRRFCGKELY
jgi:2,3-bisphosphoglycerate-independent phosphoglycerate mutase